MTNQRNLHQRHQQRANIVQRCVGFDVPTSFVVCTHSFHTTSKTEKLQTHRMRQNCTRRFFSGSSNFRKSSWKTTNQQNLHQQHQQQASIVQRYVGFDVCTSFVVCTHSFHTTFKTEKPQTHRMRQTLHVAFFLVHQSSGKAVGKRQINKIYTNDTNSTLILYNVV